jgi:DNA polymerase-3 subunit delta
VPEADQVEVPSPSGPAVAAWLRERARAARLDLVPEAAQTLVTLLGDDLSRLASELDKAALFVGEERRVGDDVVRALAGEGRVRQYWELTQAIEAADRPAALRVLESLLDAGEEPLVLLSQLTGYLRDVWRAQAGLGQRMTARQVVGLLPRRRPEWAVERLMARAAGWGTRGLAAAVRRAFETEQRLKSGGGDPRTLLTSLVADLARS